MRQIRNGVFETNSSSMHSLVIRSDEVIEGDIYLTQDEIDKEVKLYMHKKDTFNDFEKDWYFGRAPFMIMSSFVEKWKYAYSSYAYDESKQDELVKLLKELSPQVKKFVPPEYCGTDDALLDSWLKKANIDLKEFLTNKKYIIICDGDEYCIWEDMKKSGIIDTAAFEEI